MHDLATLPLRWNTSPGRFGGWGVEAWGDRMCLNNFGCYCCCWWDLVRGQGKRGMDRLWSADIPKTSCFFLDFEDRNPFAPILIRDPPSPAGDRGGLFSTFLATNSFFLVYR